MSTRAGIARLGRRKIVEGYVPKIRTWLQSRLKPLTSYGHFDYTHPPKPTRTCDCFAAARIESLDILRGIVMVVMALDHSRHFFHWSALHRFNPVDMGSTSEWVFFTRWITHFCAPIFSFLAGTGVYLAAMRGKSKSELSWFLITRGLWLVLLEFTLLGWFGWRFAVNFTSYNLSTLWSLGASMIVLAALIRLPVWAVTTFGLALILGHNAFDGIKPESWGSWSWLWSILHATGTINAPSGFTLRVGYPLLPWLGVMAVGYGFGAVYHWEASLRQRRLMYAGVATMVVFVVLRLSNVYGDLTPWAHQTRPFFTFLSFLNCTKYPPSLCYLLMTLGPGLIALSLLERPWSKWLHPFRAYGQVPFFYYMLHIPLIHALAVIVSKVCYGNSAYLFGGRVNTPAEVGFGLPVVYLVWILVVIAFYPACKWFAALKRRRHEAWLSYF